MSKKNPKKPLQDPASVGFGLSLGALLQQSGVTVGEATPLTTSATLEPTESAGMIDLSHCSKIVIRKETKHRRGKTVTLIQGLELSLPDLLQLAQEMRRALGCGSMIEDDQLLLQGDQRQRIQHWLQSKGATKIVVCS